MWPRKWQEKMTKRRIRKKLSKKSKSKTHKYRLYQNPCNKMRRVG